MRRLPLGLSLFLLFQGLYGLCASGRVERVPDEYEVYFQAESLWDRGTLAMPGWVRQVGFFGREGRDGLLYAPYGPGLAFAVLPHHAAGRAVAGLAGLEPPQIEAGRPAPAWTAVVAAVTSLATSTWAALAVLGLFVACRALGASEARAAWVSAALGVGTLLFPYGTLFFSEPITAALLIWAVAFHLRERFGPAALCLAALGLVKATNLILGPALLVLALTQTDRNRRLRTAIFYGLALAAAGLIHMEWNRHRFGNAFEFGYDWGETTTGRPQPFDAASLPLGLFGLLLSPGKSLFLFAPPVLLCLCPSRLRALASQRRDLAACLGVALATALLFYGSYMFWEGGYCPGPRHLVPLLPLLLLPLAVGPRPRAGPARACLVAGAAISLLLASVSYLEDQALGAEALSGGERHEAYYRLDPDPPPGKPANVYRLSYTPLLSYPPRLWQHLREPSLQVGEGLEFFRAHLLRVRASVPDADVLPHSVPWLLWLGFLLIYVGGLRGVRGRPRGGDGTG